MNKFRIFCALFASVVIMAAPAWSPDSDEQARGVDSESILAES
ncbi:MAG TPA: hypothetical protein VF275_07825 [Gammaproteobacteria bacterium]